VVSTFLSELESLLTGSMDNDSDGDEMKKKFCSCPQIVSLCANKNLGWISSLHFSEHVSDFSGELFSSSVVISC